MPATIQQVTDVLYASLSEDTAAGGVSTLVSASIWEGNADDDTTAPLLIFNVVTSAPHSILSSDGIDSEVQVDIYDDAANGRKNTRTIGEAVWALWNRKTLEISEAALTADVNIVGMDRGVVTEEDGELRLMQRYRVQSTY